MRTFIIFADNVPILVSQVHCWKAFIEKALLISNEPNHKDLIEEILLSYKLQDSTLNIPDSIWFMLDDQMIEFKEVPFV